MDAVVAEGAATTIKGRFRTLLSAGSQAAELPQGFLAAGQYLNKYDYRQRGLFGTAAAVRVLGHQADAEDSDSVQKLIAYLDERRRIEHDLSVAGGRTGEPGHTETKLRTESVHTFKIADVLYSLCQAPAVLERRDKLIQEYAQLLQSGRHAGGGWSSSLESPQGDVNLLATAHACRALHAAGVAVSADDLTLIRDGLDQVGPRVATFLLLTLIRVGDKGSSKGALRANTRKLWDQLEGRMDHPAELNVELTDTTDQDYVRVPWQVYLLECVLKTEPVRFLSNKRQRVVMAIVQALESSKGYVYEEMGSEQSTRTYSIVYDFLIQVRDILAVRGIARAIGSFINGASRIASHRATFALLVIGVVSFLSWSTYKWIDDPEFSFSKDVAPNIVASAILTVLAFGWYRLKRAR